MTKQIPHTLSPTEGATMPVTDAMLAAGVAALKDADLTHEAAAFPNGALGGYVPWIWHAARRCITAALAAAPAPEAAWQPIPESATGGKIIAIARYFDKWGKPEVYEWSTVHSYWHSPSRGECIWPDQRHRYRCVALPDLPPHYAALNAEGK